MTVMTFQVVTLPYASSEVLAVVPLKIPFF
jgi:hypothetical protein